MTCNKQFFFLLNFIVHIINVSGQNEVDKNTIQKLKTGLYKTEKEFLRKQPSVVKPFKILPVYSVSKKDTIITAYTYQFLDYSSPLRIYYGLFDGKIMYLRTEHNNLHKFDCLGKYPFITLKKGQNLAFYNLLSLGLSATEKLMAGVNEEVWYYNKKGTFLLATKQAMLFLLRDEEELKKNFLEEKIYTNNIFRKYLLIMNQRYPE